MATDGPTPPPCDDEIFENGQPIAALDGRSNAVEAWVQAVATKAEARIDWHYSGGVAQVLHLGDEASRIRVLNTMRVLAPELQGHVLRYFDKGDKGLFRNGVTETPPGAIAAFYDGGTESVYMIGTDDDEDTD
jgi:hypothetical protein